MQPQSEPKRGRPQGGVTVKRVSSILRLLARKRVPLAASDIAEELGMTPSSVSRIMAVLVDERLAERDPGGRYILGLRTIAIGRVALGQRPLQRVARKWLEQLTAETAEASALSVLYEDRIIYLDYVSPGGTFDLRVRAGATVEAQTAAMGKVLLAELSGPELDKFIATAELQERTPRSITSPNVLVEHLKGVREKGIAVDDEETAVGVRCFAAPVRDVTGLAVAAMSLSGSTARMTYERLEALEPTIRQAALMISREIGFVREGWPVDPAAADPSDG